MRITACLTDYTGVVYESSEGDRIAEALGPRKAIILQNHGILTVGSTVDEAAWFFITMDRILPVAADGRGGRQADPDFT